SRSVSACGRVPNEDGPDQELDGLRKGHLHLHPPYRSSDPSILSSSALRARSPRLNCSSSCGLGITACLVPDKSFMTLSISWPTRSKWWVGRPGRAHCWPIAATLPLPPPAMGACVGRRRTISVTEASIHSRRQISTPTAPPS